MVPAMKQGGSVLSGLKSNPNLAAAAKGVAYQGMAQTGMERAMGDQNRNMQRLEQASSERQQQARNAAQRAQSDSQARMSDNAMKSKLAGINLDRAFDYASLRKRNQLQWKQALLNNLAGDM